MGPLTEMHIDVEAVLADLKDFQRRTARWAFQRMFADRHPAIRFLFADEVGLGKTHVAKGVIVQAIDHLRRTGDARHDNRLRLLERGDRPAEYSKARARRH